MLTEVRKSGTGLEFHGETLPSSSRGRSGSMPGEGLGQFRPDQKSLEQNGAGLAQMLDFDTGPHVSNGLTDCLTVDPETGAVSAKNGAQYEIPVRVKNSDGSYAALGYMPIGSAADGEDPTGTGDNLGGYEDECSHNTDPDGGGGGWGDGSEIEGGDSGSHYPDERPDEPGGGDGGSGYDDHEASDPPSHPGKTGACW